MNVGNVAEFGFDDNGRLARVHDRRARRDRQRRSVAQHADGRRARDRLGSSALSPPRVGGQRGRARRACAAASIRRRATPLFSVVDVYATSPHPTLKKTVFDASQHAEFPSGMAISVDRAPRLAEDLSAVYFGIREAKKPAIARSRAAGARCHSGRGAGDGRHDQSAARERGAGRESIAHSLERKDPRLQSQQIVQEAQDRAFNFLSEYRLADNKFVRLADEQCAL